MSGVDRDWAPEENGQMSMGVAAALAPPKPVFVQTVCLSEELAQDALATHQEGGDHEK